MAGAGGGGIFISYRRQESSHLAGRLSDRLADRFGEGQVFMDVDAIGPGVDFAEEISRAVAACKVLLAVIGPNWLTTTDQRGRRRLDDPGDIVRLEIEAALARGVLVIPILAEDAVMPDREDLPSSLARLTRPSALRIRHESFRGDAERLLTAIERELAAAQGAGVPSTTGARDAEPERLTEADRKARGEAIGAVANARALTGQLVYDLAQASVEHLEHAFGQANDRLNEVIRCLERAADALEGDPLQLSITPARDAADIVGALLNVIVNEDYVGARRSVLDQANDLTEAIDAAHAAVAGR